MFSEESDDDIRFVNDSSKNVIIMRMIENGQYLNDQEFPNYDIEYGIDILAWASTHPDLI